MVLCQRLQGSLAIGDDFCRFFQEDVAQFGIGVFFGSHLQRLGRLGRHQFGRRHRRGRRCKHGGRLDGRHDCGSGWHARHQGAAGLFGTGLDDMFGILRIAIALALTGAAHGELELSRHFVVAVKLAGHAGLVAQHVDQKAQHPQAVAQFVEYGLALLGRDGSGLQALDITAHLRHGRCCRIEAEYRKDAPNLRQQPTHGLQRLHVVRSAEVLVEVFFRLAQGLPQFPHDAAHGLLVADLVVEPLHPVFQRRWRLAFQHTHQTPGQNLRVHRHVGFADIQGAERRLQIQYGSGHFHGHFGAGQLSGLLQAPRNQGQRLLQRLAARVQLHQGLGHQRELADNGFDLLPVPSSQGRPQLCRSGQALAGLGQYSRVEAPEMGFLVVHRLVTLQTQPGTYGLQDRRLTGWRIARLGAKEQHVLQQPIRSDFLAFGQTGIDHQHPRGNALGIDVFLEQAMCHGIKKACTHFPESAPRNSALPLGQPQTQLAQPCGGSLVGSFHHLQHGGIQNTSRLRPVRNRRHIDRQNRLAQAPLHRPQIGRMHFAFLPMQCLHVAVLREQGHRQHGLARQDDIQVLQQGKTGFFQGLDGSIGAVLGVLHIVLHRRFHGLKHQPHLGLIDHIQGPCRLVQLLLGHAQRAGVQRSQVGFTGLLGFQHKAAHQPDSCLQRFAQLLLHPRQRAQVLFCQTRAGGSVLMQ